MATRDVTTAGSAFAYDAGGGIRAAIRQVDSNHFVQIYQGASADGFAVVLTVNTSTRAITTGGTPLEIDTGDFAGRGAAITMVDTNHCIMFRQGVSGDGFTQILTVNTTTRAVTTAAARLEFATQDYDNGSCFLIDTNHVILFWQGPSVDGFVQVFTVNTTTRAVTTAAAPLEFDTQNGLYNSCCKIDTNHFINFFEGGAATADGTAQIITVNTTTRAVTTAGSRLVFSTDLGQYNSCFLIDANHVINIRRGTDGDGFAQVFTVNTTTWAITTAAAPLEFDTDATTHSKIRAVDTNHFIIFYQGTGTNGFVEILEVNTTTWVVTTVTASRLDYGDNVSFNTCAAIDSSHFINSRYASGPHAQVFAVELSAPLTELDIDDDLVLSENYADDRSYVDLIQDDFVLSEDYADDRSYVKLAQDSFIMSEAYSDAADIVELLQDTLHLSDDLAYMYFLELADNFVLAEMYADDRSYVKSMQDSFVLSESYADDRGYAELIQDDLVLSELYADTADVVSLIQDDLVLSEMYSDAADVVSLIQDDLILSESYASAASIVMEMADTLSLSEDVAYEYYMLVTDTLTLTEDVALSSLSTISIEDDLILSESYADDRSYVELIQDSLVLSENYADAADMISLIQDTLHLADAYSDAADLIMSIQDDLVLSEVYAQSPLFQIELSDSLVLSDTAILQHIANISVQDNFVMQDLYVDTIDVVELIQENLYLAENYADLVDIGIVIQDQIDFAENYSDAMSHPLLLTDSLTLSELYMQNVDAVLYITDTLTLDESLAFGRFMEIIDQLYLSENYVAEELTQLYIYDTLYFSDYIKGIGDPTTIIGTTVNSRNGGVITNTRNSGIPTISRNSGSITNTRNSGVTTHDRNAGETTKKHVF